MMLPLARWLNCCGKPYYVSVISGLGTTTRQENHVQIYCRSDIQANFVVELPNMEPCYESLLQTIIEELAIAAAMLIHYVISSRT
jgi:hypothetical protein